MTYPEVIKSLCQSLSGKFCNVYHSAEIVTLKDEKFPAINKDQDWINLAPEDTRETLYIRRNGDDELMDELKISSCSKSYRIRSQLRIVFFKDNAEKHEEILFNLMQSVLMQGTKLKTIVRDKWKLLKDESSGSYGLKPTSAYFAIDIYAIWELKDDACEQDFCSQLENPFSECS